MADHELPNSYPVAISTTINVAVATVISGLWATLPDATVNLIASVIGLVIMLLAGLVAHSKVSPLKGGWRTQVLELIDAGMQDAIEHALNTAMAATDETPLSVGPEPAAPAARPVRRAAPEWGAPIAARSPADTRATADVTAPRTVPERYQAIGHSQAGVGPVSGSSSGSARR